ncbi:MAG: hypothetical protein IT311_01620 [Anaerolineales bacterium]|nr:hypothetical protein [Anaerolineales bacterium]MCZ2123242.1 hypothetical protein [Anaerolineales bacterium]
MNGFRDLEQLSADLDGQLNPAESARVKSRRQADPELASAYEDLRQAKNILHKLPVRKAPKNFTLTRKMVGLKPPLPRAYPTFRFATAFATLLFVASLAVNNFSKVNLSYSAASAPMLGVGQGGGAPDNFNLPMATEAPAATEAAIAEAQMEPTLSAESAANLTDAERMTETPTTKEAPSESPNQPQPLEEAEPIVPSSWQVVLIALILLGLLALFWMNQFAKRKWRNE